MLNITVPNQLVDVNVHPAKIEVRFANEKKIFNAVYYAVKNTLEGDRSKAPMHLNPSKAALRNFYEMAGGEKPEQMELHAAPQKKDDFFVHTSDASVLFDSELKPKEKPTDAVTLRAPDAGQREADDFAFLAQPSGKKPAAPAEDRSEPETKSADSIDRTETQSDQPQTIDTVPEFRVIGEAFRTYIFVEIGDKIWIIDKHAAHERMLYEQLRSGPDGKATQLLLTPVPVTLRKDEYDALLRHADVLADAGFCVEDFGTGTVSVTSCPILLDASDVPDAIAELAAYLCRSAQQILTEKMDWIYHNTACRAAIKGGDFTTEYELRKFTEKLLSMPQIRTCPHGRPVMIEMTRREMEKSFGRV